MNALEWDEACRAFSFALMSACDSPRLIDMHRRLFDQSRRFRLALLREDRLDFAKRKTRQQQLLNAVLARDIEAASKALREDTDAELKSER